MVEHTLVNVEEDEDSLNSDGDVSSWTSETVKIWLRQNGSIDLQVNELLLQESAAICILGINLFHLLEIKKKIEAAKPFCDKGRQKAKKKL